MANILIVDDELVLRTLYSEELTEDGYEVISTENCEGLLEMIHKHRPDLILLDIKMGQYNGLDLLQDIRKAFYNIPVILSTAYSSFKHDLKAIAADYYVVKATDLRELKTKIKMALDGTLPLPKDCRHNKIRRQGIEEVRDTVGR